ncbi:MAG TPA: hypothetical protein VK994_01320 [Bacteroidales bacterium]|nr:hypothetical protein [Bacteroidales bacterium]
MRTAFIAIAFSFQALFYSLPSLGQESGDGDRYTLPSTLPDLSGLSWVEADLFIGLHDAKNDTSENIRPRISLLHLPRSSNEGVNWEPLLLTFPGPAGLSSDLESSCRIPGSNDFLFVESGQEGDGFRRMFHAVYDEGIIHIKDYVSWPLEVTNVEATEICRVGGQLFFFFAERAEDSAYTKLRWAKFSLEPLSFGVFDEIKYESVDPVGPRTRPIVAMDIDSDGFIYTASAFDPGIDSGPFRSVIWRIGSVADNGQGRPVVNLDAGIRLANLDGLKVESIAIRELPGGAKELFFGTDDENYGGIIRLLP